MRILPLAAAMLMGAAGASAQMLDAGALGGRQPDGTPLTPKMSKALAGRTAGKPVSCVQLRDIRSSRIIDASGIIYELNSKRWLVNFPAGGCSALRPERVLVTTTPTGELCRGDIARLIDPPTPIEYGSCGLGDFVPYTR